MYRVRPASDEDFDFLYGLHVAAMKEAVSRVWGWDDAVQERMFRERPDSSKSAIVVVDGQDVGVLALQKQPDVVVLVNIEILPEFQRRGLGTAIVRDVIADAKRAGLPISLRVLRGNPARNLYERLGFVVTGETETHFLMRTAGR